MSFNIRHLLQREAAGVLQAWNARHRGASRDRSAARRLQHHQAPGQPFYGINLEPILHAHNIQRIFCSGVSTVAVVQAAVRDAHDRDHVVTVLEDGCPSAMAEDHEAAIRALQRFATFTASDAVDFTA